MNTIREILDELNQEVETHLDNIDRSLNYSEKLDQIIHEIVVQTKYISFKEFIHEVQSIVRKIDIDSYSIYINTEDPCHSEYWCLVLVWHIIKDHVKNIFTSIDQITNEYPILLIDDCIYSGLQMATIIREINNAVSGNIQFNICAPYASTAISLLIPKMIDGNFIKKNYRVHTNMNKLSLNYLIGNYISPFKSKNTLNFWRFLDASPACLPIYFDHKIAGNDSSFPFIYEKLVTALPNRNPILALYKFKNSLKID